MHKDTCKFRLACRKERCCGFTLPELLIVLALIILSISSMGALTSWVENSRVDTTILNLRAALYSARAEAITRGGRVAICRRSNGILQQCAGTSALGKPDWSNGWLIFWDVDQDRVFDPDNGDLILRVFPSAHPSVKLHWNRGDYIAYQASGMLHSGNGTFCIGVNDGSDSLKEIVIFRTGRARVSSGECSYDFYSL